LWQPKFQNFWNFQNFQPEASMDKPWLIVASACNIHPYIISTHTLRSDAELQLDWLRKRLTKMSFSLCCKGTEAPKSVS
jgi:hypothetical protein